MDSPRTLRGFWSAHPTLGPPLALAGLAALWLAGVNTLWFLVLPAIAVAALCACTYVYAASVHILGDQDMPGAGRVFGLGVRAVLLKALAFSMVLYVVLVLPAGSFEALARGTSAGAAAFYVFMAAAGLDQTLLALFLAHAPDQGMTDAVRGTFTLLVRRFPTFLAVWAGFISLQALLVAAVQAYASTLDTAGVSAMDAVLRGLVPFVLAPLFMGVRRRFGTAQSTQTMS